MSDWKMKRFWKNVTAAPVSDGFQIELDGRVVKTPSKQGLVVPTRALADAIASEWDAQQDEVKPDQMPLTRMANSALDKVSVQHREVADLIAEYGGSDLLCYRADEPDQLVQKQKDTWDPYLSWATSKLGISLRVQTGIMPLLQPQAALEAMQTLTRSLDPFALTALHEQVSLSGSWVLGYAAFTRAFDPEKLWHASILDELHQQDMWGEDEDAMDTRAKKKLAFFAACSFSEHLSQDC